jgi:hypothetical protein
LEAEPEPEHEKVHKEEVVLETFRALKKRHGNRRLAARHHRQPKKWTQGNDGSRKKLVATRGRLARLAIPARCKGHSLQGQGKDTVARETRKGQTFGKRGRAKLEDINEIRIQSLKKQRCLGSERISGRIFGKTIGLAIMKRIAVSSVRIRKMTARTLWSGRPPPKRKKRPLTTA